MKFLQLFSAQKNLPENLLVILSERETLVLYWTKREQDDYQLVVLAVCFLFLNWYDTMES